MPKVFCFIFAPVARTAVLTWAAGKGLFPSCRQQHTLTAAAEAAAAAATTSSSPALHNDRLRWPSLTPTPPAAVNFSFAFSCARSLQNVFVDTAGQTRSRYWSSTVRTHKGSICWTRSRNGERPQIIFSSATLVRSRCYCSPNQQKTLGKKMLPKLLRGDIVNRTKTS